VHGETVVIAKAGKPLVKVTRFDAAAAPKRLGFMAGQGSVPDDFDAVGQSEIEPLLSATPA
jgi:antitoxin (DNA-binding transcriptional repressor) of toxin-antitoxin stability system